MTNFFPPPAAYVCLLWGLSRREAEPKGKQPSCLNSFCWGQSVISSYT